MLQKCRVQIDLTFTLQNARVIFLGVNRVIPTYNSPINRFYIVHVTDDIKRESEILWYIITRNKKRLTISKLYNYLLRPQLFTVDKNTRLRSARKGVSASRSNIGQQQAPCDKLNRYQNSRTLSGSRPFASSSSLHGPIVSGSQRASRDLFSSLCALHRCRSAGRMIRQDDGFRTGNQEDSRASVTRPFVWLFRI